MVDLGLLDPTSVARFQDMFPLDPKHTLFALLSMIVDVCDWQIIEPV